MATSLTRAPSLNSSFDFGSSFLSGTNNVNTTPYWNPSNMEAAWGIKNPTPTSNIGGNMPGWLLPAATIAAPLIGGLFGNQAAKEQRTGSAETIGLQSAMQQDMGLAGFGAQELARDREADRQLEVAQNRLNLLESGPALSQMRRQMGYQLAGKKFSPAQITQFGDMFGGYS